MRHHLVVEIDISIYSRYRSIANSNQCDSFAQCHAGNALVRCVEGTHVKSSGFDPRSGHQED